MDERRADLHMHTTYSDGELTPAELVARAAEAGLSIISVTDHDAAGAFGEARAAAEPFGMEVIPGVELSVSVGDQEIHLLGYCFDPLDEAFLAHLARFRDQRRERAERMVAALNRAGVRMAFDEVLAASKGEAIGRPHVAAALVSGGHVASHAEAFERFLRPGGAGYVEKERFPAAEALGLLHRAGGVGVLAHPGQWTPDAVLKELIRSGLDGMEVVHPSHQSWLTEYYSNIADQYELLRTGGSDFHGFRGSDMLGLGRYIVPVRYVADLKKRSLTYRSA